MQFNSTVFLFSFLPLFLLAYYIVPQKLRTGLLFVASFLFYLSGSKTPWLNFGLLFGNLLFTFLICRYLTGKKRVWVLELALSVLTAELIFFKCYQGGKLLPVGMSFYLFQIAAYVIDVYRSNITADHSFFFYGCQNAMFPKLLMGPLMNPAELQRQTNDPKCSFEDFHSGLQKFILGLALKVILANRIGGLWAQAYTIGYESISVPFAWMSLMAYAMQLYFDFWGYSLMAMGIGRMLGFRLPENFRDPYASRSVSEFWRRWHATLGAWFKEYIYIPLGGNRDGKLRTLCNLLIVWLFTGFWHGVGGNYILWALILFFFIVNERLWLHKLLGRSKVLSHIYTVMAILISWVPFAIGNTASMLTFAGRLFGIGGKALNPSDFVVWGKEYVYLLIAGIICATPLPRWICSKLKKFALTDILLFVLFWVSVFYIATSAQDPFLYFQF